MQCRVAKHPLFMSCHSTLPRHCRSRFQLQVLIKGKVDMRVLRPTYAGLCRLNCASLGCDSQLGRGNSVGHATQFGIIPEAALYAGHGPATVKLFWDLWNKKQ